MTTPDSLSDSFPRKFGKYHLLGPLAQGGMGALYLAITGDRGLERLTVIKTVLPHLADKEYVARFRDEAKVVVKLSHSNLIPVFDAGQVDGELFLAMDFVEGKDLRAVWNRCAKKQVAFPVDIAVYIVKELARGLHYAHSFRDLKLVHRDVSPPNVLISFEGEVKLTDFGLASSTLKVEKTAPGIIYGKVAYMSPEQARGEELDGRSDLYAAGIILWELLTGRQLFPPSKDQPKDLVARAKDPQVPPPSAKAPRVPPELDAICAKALAPNREDRYPTGEAFREALQAWLAKAAPTTDASRLSAFVKDLFAEDLDKDRAARQRLIEEARRRARMTLPPTAELRRLLEEEGSKQHAFTDASAPGDRPSGTMPMVGRRAEDRGVPRDRRRGDRRRGAVDVPAPGPGGKTVPRPDTASGALALSEQRVEDAVAEDDPRAFIGQVIDGRYRVLELIGEGGMGRVYLAEHVEIGRRVALKILHPVYSRLPELVERFRREARAASRIGHPHIVDVTDSGTTQDGSVYFVMEYLEGVELASVIDREGALDTARALHIAGQICRALAAAHNAGIIHRDLKPENVFLTVREGTSDFVKVLDFGIAKSAEAEEARNSRLTHPGMAMGTPEYMAPEQAAGRPADARTDVYAVGAILYEMLTGRAPYTGDNFMEILSKKASQDPDPLAEVRPDLPPAVVELVERALARDPAERPPSMEAFEYELTKCLQGRGAAVAKILGVPVSAAGGAPPKLGDGGGRAAEEAAPAQPPAPAAGAKPEPAAGAEAAPAEDGPAYETAIVPPPELALRGRAAGRVAGWALLFAALAFGVGVLLYVAVGERGARSRARASVGGAWDAAAVTRSAVAPATADAGAVARAPADAAPTATAAPAVDAGRVAAAGAAPAPVRTRTPARTSSTGAPRNRREADDLLRRAKRAENALDWDNARRLYARVAKGKYRRAAALLGLSKVAFENKQLDAAIDYAMKALQAGGGNKARMQLGHAYFKKRDFQKAIDYYEAVLKTDPGHREAQTSLNAARERLRAR
ncbi:MAG: serine/threonine protein kinase [Deltaproteobacteria bacterium]|nr:MAG: serine/threonine protein kinase [Deltaproteobacteria bacterium]